MLYFFLSKMRHKMGNELFFAFRGAFWHAPDASEWTCTTPHNNKLPFVLLTSGAGDEHSHCLNRCISSDFHSRLQDGEVTTRMTFLP